MENKRVQVIRDKCGTEEAFTRVADAAHMVYNLGWPAEEALGAAGAPRDLTEELIAVYADPDYDTYIMYDLGQEFMDEQRDQAHRGGNKVAGEGWQEKIIYQKG